MTKQPVNVLEIAARKGAFVVGPGYRNEQLLLRCINLVTAGLLRRHRGYYTITNKGRQVLAEDSK